VRRRWIIVVVTAFVLVAGGTIWFSTREREPSYNGRTLSEWLEIYCDDPQVSLTRLLPQPLEQNEAAMAVRRIGANALPWLLKWTEARAPAGTVWLNKAARVLPQALGRQWLANTLRSSYKDRSHRKTLADQGWIVLGPRAAPAVPELARILNGGEWASAQSAALALAVIGERGLDPLLAAVTNRACKYRIDVASALCRAVAGMGTNATRAGPTLVACLKDPDINVANMAAVGLGAGRKAFDPKTTVPALTNAMLHPSLVVRTASVQAVGMFGTNALQAVPALVNALSDPEEQVRWGAVMALRRISPEALEKSSAK
jgi:HEAT repeat protein